MATKMATMSPEAFKAIRKRAKLQQAELAEIIGYTADHVSRVERGIYPVPTSLGLAMAWIDVFGPADPYSDSWRPRFATGRSVTYELPPVD